MNIIAALVVATATLITAEDRATDQIPKSGDTVMIGDFQYVVLTKSDYQRLFEDICELKARYEAMNSNENGRAALHGRRGHLTITNGTVQVEYADGYKHVESLAESKRPMSAKPAEMRRENPKSQKTEFEIRREAMRMKRKHALSTTNEVTVTIER